MTWWLTIHAADGVHCWPIGDPGPDEAAELVTRGRLAARLAPDDVTSRVMLAPGEPHPQLLSRATAHTLAELHAVPRTDVDAHSAAQAAAGRQARVEAAQAAVASLPAADQATLRSRLGWGSPAPKPVDGKV